MSFEVTVTFRDMTPSPALRADIEKHAQRLLRFAPRLQSCSVTVSRAERRHRQGNHYLVHVSAVMPGRTLEAGRGNGSDRSHEDPYLVVRDAFDAVRRQAEDFMRIRRGDTKTHPSRPLSL